MNEHLQQAMAECNLTDLQRSIKKCRSMIQGRIAAHIPSRKVVTSIMDDIDHLCNLRVTNAVDSCPEHIKIAKECGL